VLVVVGRLLMPWTRVLKTGRRRLPLVGAKVAA
jgi:hypothetical protein